VLLPLFTLCALGTLIDYKGKDGKKVYLKSKIDVTVDLFKKLQAKATEGSSSHPLRGSSN
jgi:hypothetical protein